MDKAEGWICHQCPGSDEIGARERVTAVSGPIYAIGPVGEDSRGLATVGART